MRGCSRPASLPAPLSAIKNRAGAVGLPSSDQSLLLEVFGAIRPRCKARTARAKRSSTGDARGLSPCQGIAAVAATCAHGARPRILSRLSNLSNKSHFQTLKWQRASGRRSRQGERSGSTQHRWSGAGAPKDVGFCSAPGRAAAPAFSALEKATPSRSACSP